MKLKELTQQHVRQPFIFADDIKSVATLVMVDVYMPTAVESGPNGLRITVVNMYDFKEDWFGSDDKVVMEAEIRFLHLPGK